MLGRDQVEPNEKLLKIKISDKVVFVSGAGGSIGSELCRQILFLKPKKLILFEISESALYQINRKGSMKKISKKLERKVNMQVSLDKSLLGGAVIRAGDTVIDGSIRGRLTKLAESFNS